MVRKFNKAALALMVLAGSAGMASAAGPVGGINTQSVDLVFGAAATVTNTLTAMTGLTAGDTQDNTKLAEGQVATGDGSPQVMAIRFTPTVGEAGTSAERRVLSGNTAAENKLNVKLDTQSLTAGVDGWFVQNPANALLSYQVSSDGVQTVAADTYTVSVDASLYQN
ncbi:AfaD family invasin [Serratia marcescens]|uniref:AfaD family invasin n=1 Tax=Serratia marcescens TaxID=615 RepID=UPI0040465969